MGRKNNKGRKAQKGQKHKEMMQNIRKEVNKQNRTEKQRRRKQRNKGKYASDWTKFCEQLKEMGLFIRDTKGDGNCLFRSLADQLSGDERDHAEYREKVVAHMEECPAQYEPFVWDRDYDEHLRKMARNGTWGGNLELTAASRVYKVDIVVHQLGEARYEILYQMGRPDRSIHVSYHDGKHYGSVRRATDVGRSAALPIDLADAEQQLEREKQRRQIAACFAEEHDLALDFDGLTVTGGLGGGSGEAPSRNERTVMNATQCESLRHVREVLEWNAGDVDASIEFLLMERHDLGEEVWEEVAAKDLHADFDNLGGDSANLQSAATTTPPPEQSLSKRKKKSKKKGKKGRQKAEPPGGEEKEDTKEQRKGNPFQKGKCECGSGKKARKCCKGRRRRPVPDPDEEEEKSGGSKRKEQSLSRKEQLLQNIAQMEREIEAMKGKKQKRKLRQELERLREIAESATEKSGQDDEDDGPKRSDFTIAV